MMTTAAAVANAMEDNGNDGNNTASAGQHRLLTRTRGERWLLPFLFELMGSLVCPIVSTQQGVQPLGPSLLSPCSPWFQQIMALLHLHSPISTPRGRPSLPPQFRSQDEQQPLLHPHSFQIRHQEEGTVLLHPCSLPTVFDATGGVQASAFVLNVFRRIAANWEGYVYT